MHSNNYGEGIGGSLSRKTSSGQIWAVNPSISMTVEGYVSPNIFTIPNHVLTV